MLRRSREKNPKKDMTQYYFVIGIFIASMVAAGLYTLLNPQQSFASMPVIDDAQILIHNGGSNRFEQSSNEFFTVSISRTLLHTCTGLDNDGS